MGEELREGLDYTIEDGLYVFTREYLKNRGTCCRSGCRNCPYGYVQPSGPRAVSLVPSWTEMLIECGANVVGRTRYCVHPEVFVKGIPVVGGTKDLNRERFLSTQPELFILDREENPKETLVDLNGVSPVVTHIRSVDDVPAAIESMADAFEARGGREVSERLRMVSREWRRVVDHVGPSELDWETFPGVTKWLTKAALQSQTKAVYVIWRNPWMAAGPRTFIGSVLKKLGVDVIYGGEAKYPEFDFSAVSPEYVALFSSEPFPFAKFEADLKRIALHPPRAAALVDGESFSWFGTRSLRFLKAALGL